MSARVAVVGGLSAVGIAGSLVVGELVGVFAFVAMALLLLWVSE